MPSSTPCAALVVLVLLRTSKSVCGKQFVELDNPLWCFRECLGSYSLDTFDFDYLPSHGCIPGLLDHENGPDQYSSNDRRQNWSQGDILSYGGCLDPMSVLPYGIRYYWFQDLSLSLTGALVLTTCSLKDYSFGYSSFLLVELSFFEVGYSGQHFLDASGAPLNDSSDLTHSSLTLAYSAKLLMALLGSVLSMLVLLLSILILGLDLWSILVP